jgi:ectoine hydroxylase
MDLTAEQLGRFDRDGYLFFPGLFSAEEIAVLQAEVPRLYAQQRPENVREKGSDAVRTNFAAHMYSYPFAKLARHPRMVKPVMQIYGAELSACARCRTISGASSAPSTSRTATLRRSSVCPTIAC